MRRLLLTLATAGCLTLGIATGALADPGKTPPGQGHTGARIPVMAIGPQASNVLGARDQTDLFHTLIGRRG